MVRINGSDIDAAGKTVGEYLEEEGIGRTRVAVEINNEIVPKAEYDTRVLADGDKCEVVNFVGGG